MIHVAVCDDNSIHRTAAAKLIMESARREAAAMQVQLYSGAEELLRALAGGAPMDIAVLDINMNGMDGISLAKQLNQTNRRCQIIFLTGYVDYAMEVYESSHVYMVLKGRMEEKLWPAVQQAAELYKRMEKQFVAITIGAATEFLAYDEILYFEREGRKTRVKTKTGEYLTYQRLLELLEQNGDSPFVRCHNSFAVNSNEVRRLDKDCFVLTDGTSIPISRSYKRTAEEKFWRVRSNAILGDQSRV